MVQASLVERLWQHVTFWRHVPRKGNTWSAGTAWQLFSHDVCFVQSVTKIKSKVKLLLTFLHFGMELQTFLVNQPQIFLTTPFSIRYISALLLWSQHHSMSATYQRSCCHHKFCLVYYFSGKCFMYRTVPVERLGDSYSYFTLVQNVKWYAWACVEGVCSTYIPEGIQRSWIRCEQA